MLPSDSAAPPPLSLAENIEVSSSHARLGGLLDNGGGHGGSLTYRHMTADALARSPHSNARNMN